MQAALELCGTEKEIDNLGGGPVWANCFGGRQALRSCKHAVAPCGGELLPGPMTVRRKPDPVEMQVALL